jgi:hypothetical protein
MVGARIPRMLPIEASQPSAQSRPADRLDKWPLLGKQRTCSGIAVTSLFDPEQASVNVLSLHPIER